MSKAKMTLSESDKKMSAEDAELERLEKLFTVLPPTFPLKDFCVKRLLEPLHAGLSVAMKSRNIESYKEIEDIFVPGWYLAALEALGVDSPTIGGRALLEWESPMFGARVRFMAIRANDPVVISFGLVGR